MKRLKQLEEENQRLKKLVADLSLEPGKPTDNAFIESDPLGYAAEASGSERISRPPNALRNAIASPSFANSRKKIGPLSASTWRNMTGCE